MATRNLTPLFMQLRRSASRPLAGSGVEPLLPQDVEIAMPPGWVSLSTEIQDAMVLLRRRTTELGELHNQHLLPNFKEPVEVEHQIEILTADISQLFAQTQNKIKVMTQIPSLDGNTNEEDKMKRNMQSSLASQLQALSQEFRKSQQAYLSRLKGQEERSRAFNIADDESDDGAGFTDRGFTLGQQALVDNSNALIEERHRDIEQIAESIYDLAELFKDLSVLVIEQGTLLDSIEYNVEQVAQLTGAAHGELVAASRSQKKYRTKLCILLLLIIIFALIIALAISQ